MAFFKFLMAIFLFPGNLVLAGIHVTVAEDSGMLRSMINMLFWGFIAIMISLPFVF